MDVVDVLDRIRSLSEERGFTQYKLSELSGVPQSTIYNMFKRRTMPKLDNLDKKCVALDISMSDFFSAHSKPAEDGYITEDEQQLLWISRNLPKKNHGTAAEPVASAEPESEPEPVSTYEIRYKLNGGSYKGSTADIVKNYPKGTVISIHKAPEKETPSFILGIERNRRIWYDMG